MSDLLEIYKAHSHIQYQSTPILVPKRRYKREDLQRLANRWYGFVDTGIVSLRMTARPKPVVRVPIHEPVQVADFMTDSMPRSFRLKYDEYHFEPITSVIECSKREWYPYSRYLEERFWYDAWPLIQQTKVVEVR